MCTYAYIEKKTCQGNICDNKWFFLSVTGILPSAIALTSRTIFPATNQKNSYITA